MSLEFCPTHNLLQEYICAKNDCVQLTCQQCVFNQAVQTAQGIAVKLNMTSRQFFLKWTQYVLQKLHHFKEVVSQMGYSKIFQMKLSANHPKGTVSQLSFQDIERVILEALDQHRKIIQGNLSFIGGTKTVTQMIHPQFLKDLFNLVAQDAKMNLQNLPNIVQRKLTQFFPTKEIYKYAYFPISSKEIIQMQAHRRGLLEQYQQLIVIKTQISSQNETKPLPNITINKKQPAQNTLSGQNKVGKFSSNYHSSSQSQLPDLNEDEKKQQKQSLQNSDGNVSVQQMQITISLLKSNEIMYRQKISKLQDTNTQLQLQVKNLQDEIQKVKQAPVKSQPSSDSLTKSTQQENVLKQIYEQQISTLNKTISQLHRAQQDLVKQNTHLTETTLKDLQRLISQKEKTIEDMQKQINSMRDNLNFKQKSIVQLNQLISNQEEEISYRQNEVEILQGEIKKLLGKIEFLEKSVHQLNNLISNEEEQIAYRENQVETLGEEINKLLKKIKGLENSISSLNHLIANEEEEIAYRENESEILEKEVQKLLNKIAYLQKSIHQLNNLIANEEQQIAYRQNQSQTLSKQVHKLLDKNKELQRQLKILKQTNTKRVQPDQELLEQVVVLQADLANKTLDTQILVGVLQKLLSKVEVECKQFDKNPFLLDLKRLTTINSSFH